MRICPQCRTAYSSKSRDRCVHDGTALLDAEEYASLQNDTMLGTAVAERFHVTERIGSGGMGTVYRAEQLGLDRSVALKVLKPDLIADRETVTRFQREAKAMSLLAHPNTVRVFDFGEDERGNLYLAMEMLEGEPLSDKIDRDGPLHPAEAIRVIREVLGSLTEAHQKGLIHRDLKPDNIFLAQVEGQAECVVKVLDFGIAKAFRGDRKIDQLETQAGTVFGTPRYMSPEQAQGKPLDPRSDIYSVGVLLYQTLTGRAPFEEEDAVVVMAKHIQEKPTPPREAAPDQPIPKELEDVVLRALAKKADRRYSSAEEFSLALAESLPAVEVISAAGAPPPIHTGVFTAIKRLPRVPLAIGGGVLAVLLLGTGLAVGLGGGDEEDETPTDVAEVGHAGSTTGSPQPALAPEDDPEAGGDLPPLPDLSDEPAPSSEVSLRSVPTGAEVWFAGERVGVTPYDVEVPAGESVRLQIRHPGYRLRWVDVDEAGGAVRIVRLSRAGGGGQEEEGSGSAGSSSAGSSSAGSSDPYGRFN